MLKLVQVGLGQFDLAFDDPALADAEAAVATLIYGVLYTDAEAPAERVSDSFDRRGWYADPEAGSGLWHVRRQPLNTSARLEALDMVRTALKVRAPALTGVDIKEVTQTEPAGNISSVFLEVSGFHNGRKFIVKAPL
ncbi:baseplate assembly protein [Rhodocyclus tenuis]|uniref:Baseplate assembly protein n=1 Tax=Rhodocyclus gracilis TaxID=2929842 RepID=A0ABX0WEJ8_9RHOO|nr:phage GP46 family protein [Rhodocyclus gracilis]MRD73288.1 baseplate assembly protein [Rhodocyclus gracilis]NJA87711.1 baseplate assembly protein [Rhodocyclus gracilis]